MVLKVLVEVSLHGDTAKKGKHNLTSKFNSVANNNFNADECKCDAKRARIALIPNDNRCYCLPDKCNGKGKELIAFKITVYSVICLVSVFRFLINSHFEVDNLKDISDLLGRLTPYFNLLFRSLTLKVTILVN